MRESTDRITSRYLGGEYLRENPTWDSEDSPWKANLVLSVLQANKVLAHSIVDVGCGAGVVLCELRRSYPDAKLHGYDISPDAQKFWPILELDGMQFHLGDFVTGDDNCFDVALVLDVLEHLENPFEFLSKLRSRASWFVFHFPLDLSALSVLRESPLLRVRTKVGHIHFFTKGIALALLDDCGYEVVEARYTGAAMNAPNRTLKTRLAGLLRRLAYAVNRDLGARLLGGETLMVLARPRGSV